MRYILLIVLILSFITNVVLVQRVHSLQEELEIALTSPVNHGELDILMKEIKRLSQQTYLPSSK